MSSGINGLAEQIERTRDELQAALADPALPSDRSRYADVNRRWSSLAHAIGLVAHGATPRPASPRRPTCWRTTMTRMCAISCVRPRTKWTSWSRRSARQWSSRTPMTIKTSSWRSALPLEAKRPRCSRVNCWRSTSSMPSGGDSAPSSCRSSQPRGCRGGQRCHHRDQGHGRLGL